MADLKTAKILKAKVEELGGRLIAVSKKFPQEDIRAVSTSGIKDFGENYAAEAVDKINSLKDLDLRWHFIGQVQKGNLNKIVNKFYLIHSLHKIDHIKKINERSQSKQKILLQLHHEKDNRSSGVSENEIEKILKEASNFEKIDFSGLMFMPPHEFQGDELREAFKWAAGVFHSLRNKMQDIGSWDTLSMGMSDDYEHALELGSTHVRIGTAIFGKRG